MRCIKTGCDVYIESHDLLAHGDAFILPLDIMVLNLKGAGYDTEPRTAENCQDWLLIRVSSTEPFRSDRNVHIQLSTPEHWFDKGRAGTTSTLLVGPGEWLWQGYTGKPALF